MPSPKPDTPRANLGWTNRLGLGFMRLLAGVPLPWMRRLGWLGGQVLHGVAARRRRIARTNWALCFPQHSEAQRNRAVRQHFVYFVQAWLDRSWLWEANEATVRSRLRLVGATHELQGNAPTVIFAPHFVGLDAGGTALSLFVPRKFISVYAEQVNKAVDSWILKGRMRYGFKLVNKHQGLRPVVQALRTAEVLYFLPDMDMGPSESVFVPFFGVSTATVPTLPRLALLGQAKVVPVVSRITPQGYDVEILPAWPNYPGADAKADTALMNQRLEAMIQTMPEQYYWVHKRFKTRPPGEPSFYGKD
ncbi:lipid A biosynthesis acyltransferase [Hydrogenophaga sp.]|jgi:KDO2-lipid IV(A) lauroyltransferase|uniref:lysophospholipid acyltransferase family protein n=1 Tax=Hydrogenophaga sp. TaxID=1904254 RepID=UPI002AC8B8BB|nr:lipid A biosynthesis acyltransferase [Hydrogenophaga sp.]